MQRDQSSVDRSWDLSATSLDFDMCEVRLGTAVCSVTGGNEGFVIMQKGRTPRLVRQQGHHSR